MATLARAALEQQPVPLEGIDPKVLLAAVRTALSTELTDDLDWLSPPAAAAAVYELASAMPMGSERRRLGRQVLTRLYEGDAETFVTLATSLTAESRRTLTGLPIRARVALSLELPVGSAAPADALALGLLARPDLRREWLSDPASGSLPSRRLAARLLERAARESARRAMQGDTGSLRAFEEPAVRTAWRLLLNDRESLVWRHVAVARGLLCRALPEFNDEIETNLDTQLTPTEWRRAAVSLAASITVDPERGLRRCQDVLANDVLRSDNGLAGTMVFGLPQAMETEPEAAEALVNQIVRVGGLEAAEALVELRRNRRGSGFGHAAANYARERLESLLASKRFNDDGRVALCEALIEELSDASQRTTTLRDLLDDALRAFEQKSAREAFVCAQRAFQAALEKVVELEQAHDGAKAARRLGFRAMRELDVALLETATLSDLLTIGASARASASATAPLGDLFERLTNWLLRTEARPITDSGAVPHLTLRLRRLRTLLHLVDADGSYGEDVTGQRKQRRMRTANVLLGRARNDAPSPLRRIVGAALARACDALMRDDVSELSDVLVAVADNVRRYHDLTTVAEASMMPDFQRAAHAYAGLSRVTVNADATGPNARAALDALHELAQSLPWASTLRVSALRRALLAWANDLETIATANSLPDLADGPERAALTRLEGTAFTLAQLTVSARRRLIDPQPRAGVPNSGSAISALDVMVEQRLRDPSESLEAVLESIDKTLVREVPSAIARTCAIVLRRLDKLPLTPGADQRTSFVPPVPKEVPLPPWLPARRTLGGFYVLHPLGAGGVGSVFVVVRAEERHRENPLRFALKVPDYSAEAARTLSEEEFLTLFREEAGALLMVPKHPNLAGFVTFDAGARPKPILVMELVEGPTLERAIERRDMDMARALSFLDGIGAGLLSMHRAGLGHLDIKPSNVILRQPTSPQEPMQPVLVDFGLAGRKIRPGCATGPYGAPEIWGLIPDHYTPAPMPSDTYAFACLAYEVLTGDPLFDAPGELAIINAHLSHDGYPDKLRRLREHRGLETLCDLIAHGLRQHPGQRITVGQIRSGLRELAPHLTPRVWPLGDASQERSTASVH